MSAMKEIILEIHDLIKNAIFMGLADDQIVDFVVQNSTFVVPESWVEEIVKSYSDMPDDEELYMMETTSSSIH